MSVNMGNWRGKEIFLGSGCGRPAGRAGGVGRRKSSLAAGAWGWGVDGVSPRSAVTLAELS